MTAISDADKKEISGAMQEAISEVTSEQRE